MANAKDQCQPGRQRNFWRSFVFLPGKVVGTEILPFSCGGIMEVKYESSKDVYEL